MEFVLKDYCVLLISVPDWFLSISGSDSDTCGWSESTACRTLDWLLGRFYNTYYSFNHSLSLVTDTSLGIHSKLVVSRSLNKGQQFIVGSDG